MKEPSGWAGRRCVHLHFQRDPRLTTVQEQEVYLRATGRTPKAQLPSGRRCGGELFQDEPLPRTPNHGVAQQFVPVAQAEQTVEQSGVADPNSRKRPGRRSASTRTRSTGNNPGIRWASSMTTNCLAWGSSAEMGSSRTSRSRGSSRSKTWTPPRASRLRASVVLPDWRGPTRATTGNSARPVSRLSRMIRGIIFANLSHDDEFARINHMGSPFRGSASSARREGLRGGFVRISGRVVRGRSRPSITAANSPNRARSIGVASSAAVQPCVCRRPMRGGNGRSRPRH